MLLSPFQTNEFVKLIIRQVSEVTPKGTDRLTVSKTLNKPGMKFVLDNVSFEVTPMLSSKFETVPMKLSAEIKKPRFEILSPSDRPAALSSETL